MPKRHLTLATIVNRRKKPSPFLDDLVMNAPRQRRDVVQLAPKVQLPPLAMNRLRPRQLKVRTDAPAPAVQTNPAQGTLCSIPKRPREPIRKSRCGQNRFIHRARSLCN